MAFRRRILWVDDDISALNVWKNIFSKKGIDTILVSSFSEAKSQIEKSSFDGYLMDLEFEGEEDGIDLVYFIRKIDNTVPIFILSGYLEEPQWEQKLSDPVLNITDKIGKPLPLESSPDFEKIVFKIESEVLHSMHLEMKRKYGEEYDPGKILMEKKGKGKNCFVLMPFSGDFDDIYSDHIKSIVEYFGLECNRADEIYSIKPIIDDIINSIEESDIIIADLTKRNPNVFYELGIAHAIEKPVILISQSTEDIPFDVKHRRCILYRFVPKGMKKFEDKLKKTLENVIEEISRR